MFFINSRFAAVLASITVFLTGSGFLTMAEKPSPAASKSGASRSVLSPEQFARAQALIKPQAGEAKWLEIPWEIDVWQARQKAAAAGKPIFFLTGGGKSPLGDC